MTKITGILINHSSIPKILKPPMISQIVKTTVPKIPPTSKPDSAPSIVFLGLIVGHNLCLPNNIPPN